MREDNKKVLTGAELSLPAQFSDKFMEGAEQAIALVRARRYRRRKKAAAPVVRIFDRWGAELGRNV